MAQDSCEAVEAEHEVVRVAGLRELQKQVREFQLVLDKNTTEHEILRKAARLAHQNGS